MKQSGNPGADIEIEILSWMQFWGSDPRFSSEQGKGIFDTEKNGRQVK
jgi:hypothetical protein